MVTIDDLVRAVPPPAHPVDATIVDAIPRMGCEILGAHTYDGRTLWE